MAHYEEAGQVLSLATEARVLDEGQGSDLRADGIELRGKSGDVSARGKVRHQITPKSKTTTGPFGRSPGPGLAGDEPALRLRPHPRTARYQENALLRSGDDEVRAPRHHARGSAPRASADDGERRRRLRPAPARAKRGRGRTSRRGGAGADRHAQQGDGLRGGREHGRLHGRRRDPRRATSQTKSPEATVPLDADGSGHQDRSWRASPWRCDQGQRRANGERGTYTPATRRWCSVGEKVVLQGPEAAARGPIFDLPHRATIGSSSTARSWSGPKPSSAAAEALLSPEPRPGEPNRRRPPDRLRGTGLTKTYGRRTVVRDVDAEHPRGRGGGAARPERRGQDHDLLHGGGPGAPRRGQGLPGRRGHHRAADVPARARRASATCPRRRASSASSRRRRTSSPSWRRWAWRAAERRPRARALLEELGIPGLAQQPAYTLSGGERRRLEIAAPSRPRPPSSSSTSRSPASTRSR